MSTTTSTRPPTEVRTNPPVTSEPTTEPTRRRRPNRTPDDSRFRRVRDFLFGMGDDRVDLTTVQSHALRQLIQR